MFGTFLLMLALLALMVAALMGCSGSAGEKTSPVPRAENHNLLQPSGQASAGEWQSGLPEEWRDPVAVQFVLISKELRRMLAWYIRTEGAWPATAAELLANQPFICLPTGADGVPYAIETAGAAPSGTPGTLRLELDSAGCALQFFYREGDLPQEAPRNSSVRHVLSRTEAEERAVWPHAVIQEQSPDGGQPAHASRESNKIVSREAALRDRTREAWEQQLKWYVDVHGALPANLPELLSAHRFTSEVLVAPAASELNAYLLAGTREPHISVDPAGLASRFYLPRSNSPEWLAYEKAWERRTPGMEAQPLGVHWVTQEAPRFQAFALIRIPELPNEH